MKSPTRKQLTDAVAVLADHYRGRMVLNSLLALFKAGADGLDTVNQQALLTVLAAKFGPFAGSTISEIRGALDTPHADDDRPADGLALSVRLSLDNAAFADGGTEEIRRILSDLCDRLPEPLRSTPGDLNLRDVNGNHCGTARIE